MADSREINWVLSATDKTAQAFRSVDSRLAGITKSLKSFAGFAGFGAVAAGIGSLTSSLVEMGSQLQDASDKLGVSAESLQVLKFAAEQSGASFDALQTALAFNTKLTGNASRGNKEAADTFRLLGLDAKKFADLPIDKRLAVIAQQLSNVTDPALRLDLTLKALGKGGADLAPLLAQGATGIAAIEKQLRSSNSLLSNDQVKALDDAGDAWDAFALRLKVGFAPGLVAAINTLTNLVNAVDRFAHLSPTAMIFGEETDRMLRSAQGRDRGPINPRGSPRSAAGSGAIVGAAGNNAPADVPAKVGKAAKEALSDVDKLVLGIAELSGEVNRDFATRGEKFAAQFRDPIAVLKEQLLEVNALWVTGAIDSDTAARAVQAYGDAAARALPKVDVALGQVADKTDDLLVAIRNATQGFASELTDAFFNATEGIGQMFKNLAATIAKALFTQTVSQPLIDAVLGSFGGARAGGGPVGAGKTYLVGERGPELFVPGGSGSIIPNGAGGGGGVSIVNHFTVTALDPQSAAQVLIANERLLTGMTRRSMMRAGVRPQLA